MPQFDIYKLNFLIYIGIYNKLSFKFLSGLLSRTAVNLADLNYKVTLSKKEPLTQGWQTACGSRAAHSHLWFIVTDDPTHCHNRV